MVEVNEIDILDTWLQGRNYYATRHHQSKIRELAMHYLSHVQQKTAD